MYASDKVNVGVIQTAGKTKRIRQGKNNKNKTNHSKGKKWFSLDRERDLNVCFITGPVKRNNHFYHLRNRIVL